MEFFILRNEPVIFPRPFTNPSPAGWVKRYSLLPKAEILATKTDDHDGDGIDNQKYSNKLTTALFENPFYVKYRDTKMDWNLKVAINLPDPIRYAADGVTPIVGPYKHGNLMIFMELEEGKATLLAALHKTFNVHEDGGGNDNVTLNLIVKDFGPKKNPSFYLPSTINWTAKRIVLQEVFKPQGTYIECTYPLIPKPEKHMLTAWKDGEEFLGNFTISVVLNDCALSLLDSLNLVPTERFDVFRNMLENEICTDVEILVGCRPNQKVVKCHRAVLASGSKVFQEVFEGGGGMRRTRGLNRITVEEMSENGFRALLAYLYYKEVKMAYGNSEIALELLKAGEKYGIEGLKNVVREYMMAKEWKWFGIDVAVMLYVFVRKLEDDGENVEDEEMEAWKSLKIKCLKVLKWYNKNKPNALLESVKYTETFRKKPKLGIEITSEMIRLN